MGLCRLENDGFTVRSAFELADPAFLVDQRLSYPIKGLQRRPLREPFPSGKKGCRREIEKLNHLVQHLGADPVSPAFEFSHAIGVYIECFGESLQGPISGFLSQLPDMSAHYIF